jgi:UDP-glucuronate decarboxylase
MRIFNTYGPRMDIDDGRVISNFIVQALREKDLTIFGDGSQTRCFCYVDDLVTGMLNLMNTPNDITGPVNVGSNNEMTILSIADEIIKITGTKSKIKFLDPVVDDPKQRKPDLTLAKKIIDWNPKINLESGLIKTIEYFKSVI